MGKKPQKNYFPLRHNFLCRSALLWKILSIMKLKNLGWQSFFSLLLADLVGIVMLWLGIKLKITLWVAALVFAILLVVMAFGLHAKLRARKREEAAVSRVAELQKQVDERKDEPAQ